jgi:exonuclease SbcC
MQRFAQAVRRRDEHEQARESFELAAHALEVADRADPVRPLLAALDESAAAVAAVLAAEPSAERLVGIDWAAQAQRAGTEAAELNYMVDVEARLPDIKGAVAEARRELRRTGQIAEQLAMRAAAVPGELAAARTAEADARAQAQLLEPASVRLADLVSQAKARAELGATDREHAQARAQRDQAHDSYVAAADEHLRLAELRVQNMAGELATALHDGDACPVCGNTDHPRLASPPPGAAGAAEVAAALDRRRAAERARERADAALAELDVRRASLAARAGDNDADAAQQELDAARRAVAAADGAAKMLPPLEAARAGLEVESAQLAGDREHAVHAAAQASAALESAESELAETVAVLEAGRGEHESVAAHRAALLSEAASATRFATVARSFETAQAAHDAALLRAIDEAESSGFATVDEARSAVLTPGRRDELRAGVNDWAAMSRALHAAVTAAEFEGLTLDDHGPVIAEAAAAKEVVRSAEAAVQASAVDADRARSAADAFARARESVRAAATDHDALAAAAGPVVHLAKLARGVAGRRRVNLTTYVLRQWFEQVVAAANLRLAGMSSGRFELVRVDEGASRTERSGLTLQVLDRHTGEHRNPRSLSGGETFYTSLALALGLADVVRAEAGGVDLDTLFIDEGFGSLDADTLDQVMAVIDELRDRGRSVGIVSHVHELKNRIAERIEVRRLPDGSSTLRVVA